MKNVKIINWLFEILKNYKMYKYKINGTLPKSWFLSVGIYEFFEVLCHTFTKIQEIQYGALPNLLNTEFS